MANNDKQWCFTWIPDKPLPPGTVERAVLLLKYKWPEKSQITISFLDGDPEVIQRVKTAAMAWTTPGPANLTFIFRTDTTDTDIRISFLYAGSWSVLGTSCKTITDLARPTMNFGWLNKDSTDAEVKRVVLHEFGHALGLIHEHLSPDPEHPIHWNKEKVIEDLSGPPNNWNMDTINTNMFQTFEASEANFTRLDPTSIMMYPIPAKWTTDGFSTGLNVELSETDKNFIQTQYP